MNTDSTTQVYIFCVWNFEIVVTYMASQRQLEMSFSYTAEKYVMS